MEDIYFDEKMEKVFTLSEAKNPFFDEDKDEISEFCNNYRDMLLQVLELSPMLGEGIVALKGSDRDEFASSTLLYAGTAVGCAPAIGQPVGAVMTGLGMLWKDRAENDLIKKIGNLKKLKDVRSSGDRTDIAKNIINKHVLHVAMKLGEDAGRKRDYMSAYRVKKMFESVLNEVTEVAKGIQYIGSRDDVAPNDMSIDLHHDDPEISPRTETASRMSISMLHELERGTTLHDHAKTVSEYNRLLRKRPQVEIEEVSSPEASPPATPQPQPPRPEVRPVRRRGGIVRRSLRRLCKPMSSCMGSV